MSSTPSRLELPYQRAELSHVTCSFSDHAVCVALVNPSCLCVPWQQDHWLLNNLSSSPDLLCPRAERTLLAISYRGQIKDQSRIVQAAHVMIACVFSPSVTIQTSILLLQQLDMVSIGRYWGSMHAPNLVSTLLWVATITTCICEACMRTADSVGTAVAWLWFCSGCHQRVHGANGAPQPTGRRELAGIPAAAAAGSRDQSTAGRVRGSTTEWQANQRADQWMNTAQHIARLPLLTGAGSTVQYSTVVLPVLRAQPYHLQHHALLGPGVGSVASSLWTSEWCKSFQIASHSQRRLLRSVTHSVLQKMPP